MGVIRTLIVCEKPDAAARVARALDKDGDPRRIESQGVPVYESRRQAETILVCSAIGHLYTTDSKTRSSRRYFPVWDQNWKEKHLVEKKSARLARWLQTIKSFAVDADRLVNACDFDTEGSVIGHTIIQYACKNAQRQSLRMKFSTMTDDELQRAYRNLSPGLDLSNVESGKCRHEVDWIYGINLSRLLTESATNQSTGYSTLSTGRVQGPTLRFVVQREEEIQCFTPCPFWTIEAVITHEAQDHHLEYFKERISTLAEATQIVRDCKDSLLTVDHVESVTVRQEPPHPFDLSTLQSEAYRVFGYTPSRALATAERLYLKALISYPRTDSQALPPDINYPRILDGLSTDSRYHTQVSELLKRSRLHPNQGPKQDPAHPAIYPTGLMPKGELVRDEEKLLDLVIRRFLATFAEPSIQEEKRINLRVEEHKFFLRGLILIRVGWIEFYMPYATVNSTTCPNPSLGGRIRMSQIEAKEKFTQPPERFNPSSLVRKMEREKIGTKATRAETVDVLYQREYIKGTRIEPTPLAINVTRTLQTYCPSILDPELSAQLESEMSAIESSDATRQQVVAETVERLRPIMLDLITNEVQIGKGLAQTVLSQRIARMTLDTPCPACGDKLRIIKSRTSGKRFVGCHGYEKGCRFTLPLPQIGRLALTRRFCKVCGFQLVRAKNRHWRPLTSCPRCYSSGRKLSSCSSARSGRRSIPSARTVVT